MEPSESLRLRFVAGTVEVSGLPPGTALDSVPELVEDRRSACHRAPAHRYAELVLELRARYTLDDQARQYEVLPFRARVTRVPRPFQSEALAAWSRQRGRGVVVLPTGAGKSQVAVMAIDHKLRSTLVVVPTLDLVRQWYDLLRVSFACDVGVVGGGDYRVEALTVTTYDSAYLHMEHLGHRFGLVVFDECHHLPGETFSLAARQSLAPFRLGLTATPERADGRESILTELIGPIVYRKDIVDLSGSYLADYEVQTLDVHLTEAERAEYDAERALYLAFLRKHGIRMGDPRGWGEFIMRSSTSREGQRAMQAYRRQKELAVASPAKLDLLETLLAEHASDAMLVFTQDNATAYQVSRRFLVPAITHQTKVTERSEILDGLRSGRYNSVVTSKVLNEGVDVPAANVAVILGGSGSVREHVQRLGRILRRGEGKLARLYEVVSAGTAETGTSERRRDHEAYR
jgi:superfamily II DNA or RNA helicase